MDLAGNVDEEQEAFSTSGVTSELPLPVTGQPHADAEKKKKWLMYGLAAVFGLFVMYKMFGGHGHGNSQMQHPQSHTPKAGHGASGAKPKQLRGGYIAPTCPRTRVFPYHEGCPSLTHCRKRWAGVPKTDPLYGMKVSWELGSLEGMHDAATAGSISNLKMRKMFRVDPHFVRDFIRLEDELSYAVNRSLTARHEPHILQETVQPSLSIALGWLCCLEKHEMNLVREILDKWVVKYQFRVPLQFDHVKCYHNKLDGVNTMLVASDHSQLRLRRINVAMQRAIAAGGVPVLESHEMIVPFHATLLGIHTKNHKSIAPFLGAIAQSLHQADRNVMFAVTITGDPRLGTPFSIKDHPHK